MIAAPPALARADAALLPGQATPAKERGALLRRAGPLAGLIRFDGEAGAVMLADDGRTGLATYPYTRDAPRLFRLGDALRYGMVVMNMTTIATEVGGIREPGRRGEGGRQRIDDHVDARRGSTNVSAGAG